MSENRRPLASVRESLMAGENRREMRKVALSPACLTSPRTASLTTTGPRTGDRIELGMFVIIAQKLDRYYPAGLLMGRRHSKIHRSTAPFPLVPGATLAPRHLSGDRVIGGAVGDCCLISQVPSAFAVRHDVVSPLHGLCLGISPRSDCRGGRGRGWVTWFSPELRNVGWPGRLR